MLLSSISNPHDIHCVGKVVSDFNKKHKISPDTRATVQFVDDPELAYVMQVCSSDEISLSIPKFKKVK